MCEPPKSRTGEENTGPRIWQQAWRDQYKQMRALMLPGELVDSVRAGHHTCLQDPLYCSCKRNDPRSQNYCEMEGGGKGQGN